MNYDDLLLQYNDNNDIIENKEKLKIKLSLFCVLYKYIPKE